MYLFCTRDILCEDPFILSFTKYLGTQISEIVLKVVLMLTAPILCRKLLKKASVLSFDVEKSSFLAMSKRCVFCSWSPKWVGFWTFSLSLRLLFGRWYCSWDPAEGECAVARTATTSPHLLCTETSMREAGGYMFGACPDQGKDVDTRSGKL